LSRFDQGRWNRVVIWTGATLAWGSAMVAARIDAGRDVATAPEPTSAQAEVKTMAAFPVPPEHGLLVIRQGGTTAASAPVPAPVAQPSPAPAPVSQGS
jgi:hypothetical protein